MIAYDFGDEFRLITKIRSAETSSDDRTRFIAQLETLPVRIYPFYHRWLLLHDVEPFESWDDNGFFPERSPFPREVQILWATSYGVADIENGGFHQFFWNGTGNFAPEMCECLDLLDLAASAQLIRESMRVFGVSYPRPQRTRQTFLDRLRGEHHEEWDPFDQLNDAFYSSLEPASRFDAAADRLLREKCGKTTLAG